MADEPTNDLDTATAAALIGVSPRWVQKLAKDGWFTSSSRGRWPLVPLVQGYIRSLKAEVDRQSKTSSDSRFRDARAKLLEVKTAKEAGELIPQAEAFAMIDMVCGDMMAAFEGLPAEITRNARERERIRAILDARRKHLADGWAEKLAHARESNIASEAAGEDDA